MKESKIESILRKCFIYFLILQPFLDIYFLFTDRVINIFKFSPSTLIRFAFIGIMFIYMLVKYRRNKKILPVVGFAIITAIYAVLHHIFVRNFTSYDPNNFGYSTFKELFYIARLFLPVIMMFIVVDFKITFEELRKTICIVATIVGTVIVFSNLFKIGLGSYTNEVIKDNIFGWFTGAYTKYSFYELACKGWFNFANQISALVILLALMTLYSLVKKISAWNIYNVIVILLSMLMLGTKVALYGAFLSLAALIFIFAFDRIILKNKIDVNKYSLILIVILLVGYVGCIKFSPAQNRAEINNYIAENREKKDEEKVDMNEINRQLEIVKGGTYEEKIEFIEEYFGYYSIAAEFIEDGYSYKIDPDFWIEEFQKPLSDRLNYRKLEESMIKRVESIDGKLTNIFFGISYIRVQNIFNIERDFILQYYTIGIIGLILFIIIPFVVPVIALGIYLLMNRTKINLENMVIIAGIVLVIAIAYFSGNIIDSLIMTTFLSLLNGVLFNCCNIEGKKEGNVKLLKESK